MHMYMHTNIYLPFIFASRHFLPDIVLVGLRSPI